MDREILDREGHLGELGPRWPLTTWGESYESLTELAELTDELKSYVGVNSRILAGLNTGGSFVS